ncbi:MAG: penicillin-binding protein [Rhodococcus sp.]|nr:penicillin-binding protein [Rhodococcus sp. (in: high G+C Gram-positive bacteria)]
MPGRRPVPGEPAGPRQQAQSGQRTIRPQSGQHPTSGRPPPRRPVPARRPPVSPPRGGAASRPTKPAARPRRRRHLIWRVLTWGFIVFLVLPVTAFAVAYTLVDVPSPNELNTNQVATVLAADGTTEIARIVPPEGNRKEIPLQDIPSHVQNAVLSAEDRDFYANPGFSVSGFSRAARDNLLGRESAGGGSTITQQYVKNVLVGGDRNVLRKMRELVVSTKMTREWSKQEILGAYLNTIYYGRGAYGIEAAAQTFFGRPTAELDVAQGAVLAGLIQSPSYLDPEVTPGVLESRWNYVLDGMVSMGVLSATERHAQVFPPINPPVMHEAQPVGPEGLVRGRVLAELAAVGIDERMVNTRGLRITTTIDPKAQQAAVDSVRSAYDRSSPLRSAVVSIDPRTGGVRAYYGGDEGVGYDFAQAPVQTGSSFKVFGLIAALKQGVSPDAPFDSGPLTIGNLTIRNAGGDSCGTCSLAEATKLSLNTSFYRMMMSLNNGPQSIADAAHEAGIPIDIPGVAGPSLSEGGGPPEGGIVLGQYLVRPIDMASAYATLAASGTYRPPYFVERVVDADGHLVFQRPPSSGEQRITPAIADNISAILQPVAGHSNGNNLAGGRVSAAKTGTAQLGDTGQNKDAWMVGYTPSLSTAVWLGTADASAIRSAGGAIYGAGLPSTIWKSTMDGALKDTPQESFPTPGSVPGQSQQRTSRPSPTPREPLPPITERTPIPRWTPADIAPPPVNVPEPAAPPPPPPAVPAPPPVPPPPPPPPPPPRQIEVLPGVIVPIP